MSLAYGPPALLGLVVRAHAALVGPRLVRGRPRARELRDLLGQVRAWWRPCSSWCRPRCWPSSLSRFFEADDAASRARGSDAFFGRLDTPGGRGRRAGRRPRSHGAGLPLPEPRHGPRGPGEPARALLRGPRGSSGTVIGYVAHDPALGRRPLVRSRRRPAPPRRPRRSSRESSLAVRRLVLGSSVPAQAGVRVGLGGERRREDRRDAPREPARGPELGLGRQDRPALRRAQRDRRLPGDRGSRRPGRSASLDGGAAGARGPGGAIRYAPPPPIPPLYVGRPIQLFSVHYLNVTKETQADWAWKPGSPAAPRDPRAGSRWSSCPRTHGRAGAAFRCGSTADRTRRSGSRCTRGASRPAGRLSRRVDGRRRTARRSSLPVELQVLDFALPDENSLRAMVYYEPDQPELYQGRNLDPAYHRFAHRQRVELVHAYDEAQVTRAPRPLRRHATSRRRTATRGRATASATPSCPPTLLRPRAGVRGARERLEGVRRLDGLRRPDGAERPDLPVSPRRALPRSSTRTSGSSRTTCARTPAPAVGFPPSSRRASFRSCEGAIDIWCVPPQAYDIAKADEQRKKGRRVWFYNGGRPQGPTLLIDAPATDARVVAWAAFKHDVDVYFFWHGVHWQHNRQKQGERRQNVWADPITFDNRGQPEEADRRPGLPERGRRPHVPGRGEDPSARRIAVSRVRARRSSSRTSAAACRTTSI